MKSWIQYTLNKVDPHGMKFLYLRIGKGERLFDELQAIADAKGIIWDLKESNTFRDYNFSGNLEEYDGFLINLGILDDEISDFRKDFWENFIWKTENFPFVTALIVPNTESVGSLTKSQIIEALSLIRVIDRPIELFENSEDTAEKVTDWIINMTIVAHRKTRSEPKLNE